MHICLVSERPEASGLAELTQFLARASSTVRHVATWDPAEVFAEGSPDALVVDLASPGAHPTAVRALSLAAHQNRTVPVLGLLPRPRMAEVAPDLGLDDFSLLPLDPQEVYTRLGLLRARYRAGDGDDILRLGDLRIDLSRYEVWVGHREVVLTFKEYELLRILASNPGRVFTREVLLDRVWGYDYFGGTRTVDVHIRRLRSKLEDPDHTFVETVRNVGYRFRVEPPRAAR